MSTLQALQALAETVVPVLAVALPLVRWVLS